MWEKWTTVERYYWWFVGWEFKVEESDVGWESYWSVWVEWWGEDDWWGLVCGVIAFVQEYFKGES